MIFTFIIPCLFLTATANGAVLPNRGPTEVENRDFLDDLGEILSDALPVVESLIGGLVDPQATPTDHNVGVLVTQYPASASNSAAPILTIPGTPLSSGPGPTGMPTIRSLSLAGPFPSLAVVNPHDPAGIRLPGSPFMVTAPAAAAVSAGPARRSLLNARQDMEVEKRINIDGIVSAVVDALPTAIQDKVAPIVHDLLPGATNPTGSSSPTAGSPPQTQNAAVVSVTTAPLHTPNAAHSLRGESAFTLTGSIVIVGSIILGAVVVL